MAAEGMYRASVILRESLPFLMGLLVFSFITGGNLEAEVHTLVVKFILLLLVLPAFINMEGALAAVFTARLTSHLYVGTIDRKFKPYSVLATDLLGVLATATSGFLFLSLIAALLNHLIFALRVDSLTLVATFMFAGLTATLAMCLLGLLVAYIAYRRGLNPDNFTSPVTQTVGDAVGTILLLVAAKSILLVR